MTKKGFYIKYLHHKFEWGPIDPELYIRVNLTLFCFCFTAIYCSMHVRLVDMDKVMLYNPLLCAFSPHANNVVLSALNVDLVYGPRSGCWTAMVEGRQSKALPKKWTPICKKAQPIKLEMVNQIEMICETAKNTLPCVPAQVYTSGGHYQICVEVLHTLIKNMLDTFLSFSGDNNLCEPSSGETPSEEDLPYMWRTVMNRM